MAWGVRHFSPVGKDAVGAGDGDVACVCLIEHPAISTSSTTDGAAVKRKNLSIGSEQRQPLYGGFGEFQMAVLEILKKYEDLVIAQGQQKAPAGG